jgi:hypothetical protein
VTLKLRLERVLLVAFSIFAFRKKRKRKKKDPLVGEVQADPCAHNHIGKRNMLSEILLCP